MFHVLPHLVYTAPLGCDPQSPFSPGGPGGPFGPGRIKGTAFTAELQVFSALVVSATDRAAMESISTLSIMVH